MNNQSSAPVDGAIKPESDGQLICPNCHRSDHCSGGWPATELDNGLLKSVCDGCGSEVIWKHPADIKYNSMTHADYLKQIESWRHELMVPTHGAPTEAEVKMFPNGRI